MLLTLAITFIASVTSGLIGDGRGWFEGRPFLVNLMSAVAGGSFGVPALALVVAAAQRTTALRGWSAHHRKISMVLANEVGEPLLGLISAAEAAARLDLGVPWDRPDQVDPGAASYEPSIEAVRRRIDALTHVPNLTVGHVVQHEHQRRQLDDVLRHVIAALDQSLGECRDSPLSYDLLPVILRMRAVARVTLSEHVDPARANDDQPLLGWGASIILTVLIALAVDLGRLLDALVRGRELVVPFGDVLNLPGSRSKRAERRWHASHPSWEPPTSTAD